MKKGIIGKKLGMTQIFDEVGNVIPVTLIEAGPCEVAQKKTVENDGYDAIQLAYCEAKEKHLTKAELGHFKKAGISPKRHLKEFRLADTSAYEVGSKISVDTFAAGEKVVEVAKRNGSAVSGPIPLPTDKEIVTILRAVHKYKDSREQFETRTHKRLVDILNPQQKTIEDLMSLELPAGVEIEIKA